MTVSDHAERIARQLRLALHPDTTKSARDDLMHDHRRTLAIALAEDETGMDHLWASAILRAPGNERTIAQLRSAQQHMAVYWRHDKALERMMLPDLLAYCDALASVKVAA